MKQKEASSRIFFIAAVLYLAVNGILLFVLPQQSYSENENRCLTTFQSPSLSGFMDTSMQENMTDGANDQFAGRDCWMKFATALQRTAGFQDTGGVYLGKNGYYFERILNSGISQARYANNLNCLKQFASAYSNTKTVFLPVPSKGTVLAKELPANAVLYDAARLYSQAETQLEPADVLDIRSKLSAKTKECRLYFKTDHHWTMEASYLAYTVWCSAHGRTAKPLEQFQPKCASQDFYGTLYSKAPGFFTQPDQLLIPSALASAKITIDGNETDSIYDLDKLSTKDKYGVYFGGNFGRIDIKTDNSDRPLTSRTLLVIKDSFANSLIPFLMEDYSHIIMLDFRYYNKPVSELMKEIQPEETLILYEMSNFAQDPNFFKILK